MVRPDDGMQTICAVCRAPLNPREQWRFPGQRNDPLFPERLPGARLDGISYQHPAWMGVVDHDPEPVLASYGEAAGVCDFCGVPDPVVRFLTGNAAVIRVQRGDDDGDVLDMGSSPWAACRACSAIIVARNLRMLVARTVARAARQLDPQLSRRERRAVLAVVERRARRLQSAFLDTRPHGPFPLHGPVTTDPGGEGGGGHRRGEPGGRPA